MNMGNKVCPICKNSENNEIIYIKERRIKHINQPFEYILCSACGTLSINESIENLGDYYWNEDGEGYYAYLEQRDIEKYSPLKIWLYLHFRRAQDLRSKYADTDFGNRYNLLAGAGKRLKRNDPILDVGCGSGNWLRGLCRDGWTNLTGVDAYCPNFDDSDGKICFYRGEIYDIPQNEKYKLISLSSSFEHMDDPNKVLRALLEHMDKDGTIVMRMPVMGKSCWEKYGTDWCQLDAPRHLHLYTEDGLRFVCDQEGLKITDIIYDGRPSHYYLSWFYRKTKYCRHKVTLSMIEKMTIPHHNDYVQMALSDNNEGKASQAIYFIKRKGMK